MIDLDVENRIIIFGWMSYILDILSAMNNASSRWPASVIFWTIIAANFLVEISSIKWVILLYAGSHIFVLKLILNLKKHCVGELTAQQIRIWVSLPFYASWGHLLSSFRTFLEDWTYVTALGFSVNRSKQMRTVLPGPEVGACEVYTFWPRYVPWSARLIRTE